MIKPSDPKNRWKRNVALLFGAALLSAGFVLTLWLSHPSVDYWLEQVVLGRAYLEARPWALFLVLATLPGLGVPSSPLIILFGAVLGPRFGLPLTVVMSITAQSICTIWTYALAAGPLRQFLLQTFFRNRPLPEISSGNAVRLGLILRLTPGVPYALQNIVLGLVGMRFRPYLLVSIPTIALWNLGFVVTGGAIFEGRFGLALTGLAIIIALVLATRMLNQKYKNHAR
ncbi:MAG: DedA family protein [Puniceicoccaceae bacterium]|nr:MAG: DedA family protein [Puniceicoccaceae bacterium]